MHRTWRVLAMLLLAFAAYMGAYYATRRVVGGTGAYSYFIGNTQLPGPAYLFFSLAESMDRRLHPNDW